MPLRVLHATPSFAPAYQLGGPTYSLEGLVIHLGMARVDVRVLTTNSNGWDVLPSMPSGWVDWKGVPVRYLHRWGPPAETPAYAVHALVEARRADVVHVSGLFSTSPLQALAVARQLRKPVVFSPRGTLQSGALAFGPASKKRAWLWMFRPLLRTVAIFHATSDSEAGSIADVLGSDVRVKVVPNGTDLPDPAHVNAARARSRAKPVVGFLGRIHRIKALENLIEAGGLLKARGFDFDIHLAGPFQDPTYRRELEQVAETAKVVERVTFVGEVDGAAKTDFYAQCRVAVLPSRSENFGNATIEALAHGTPVVASRGTPWAMLEDWGAGRWVNNAPASLADAIEIYLRDEAVARRAGELGRAEVERRYGWATVAGSMADVYRELVYERGEKS